MTFPLAKLTRPRLHQVVPRERLFALLDDLRSRPATWIAAEPGAGKTTLVASWIEARRMPCLWVQIDAADADPGTFFHYFREAAVALHLPKRLRLPTFAPEFSAAPEAFGRRYFRSCFSALPPGAVIVLDNFQEAAGADFEAVIRSALEELAEHVHLVIVSREVPGAAYARFVANERLATLGAADLKFAEAESRALAAGRGVVSAEALATLHRLSSGWAAGMTLMIERMKRGELGEAAPDEDIRSAAFDYFAGVLFESLPPAEGSTLLAISFLPSMTAATAAQVSGNPEAGKLLERLYRRRMFTDRRGNTEPMYQFHALFRAFLRARASADLDAARQRALALAAGEALRAASDFESALDLFAEGGDWVAFASLLESVAGRWLAQGRRQMLLDRIGKLPASVSHCRPWTRYWHGTALIAVDLGTARASLADAFEQFESAGDRHGMRLAGCGLVDAHHVGYSGIAGLGRWVEALEGLMPSPGDGTDAETEFRLLYASLTASCFLRHRDDRVRDHASRLLALMREPLDAALRLRAGYLLMRYGAFSARYEVALAALELTEPLLADAAASEVDQIIWYCRAIMIYMFRCRFEDATKLLEPATAIARVMPRHATALALCALRMSIACATGRMRTVEAISAEILLDAPPQDPYSRGLWAVPRLLASLYRGDYATALTHAHTAVEGFRAASVVHAECEFALAEIHLLRLLGQHAAADAAVASFQATVADSFMEHLADDLAVVEADAALRRGENAACEGHLRVALRRGNRSYLWIPRLLPGVLPNVFAHALETGIEPDIVRARIRAMQVRPPSPAAEGWPWPVRIRALGPFELETDKGPQHSGRKPAHRLLDLLKLLASAPAGGVATARVVDLLWPDSEGDAGEKLIETSLHRLRRLLGNDEAVPVRDGTVQLNPQVCGVDVWAFEQRCAAAAASLGTDDYERHAGAALALYRGHLLATTPDLPWVLGARERLRSLWLEVVLALGARQEARGHWSDAATTYGRAADIDPANELLYQRRIGALRQLGNPGEAMRTLEVCKRMLAAHLGVRPSSETMRLAGELGVG